MFTGIIEELGRVREVEKRGEDARIVIEALLVTEDIHEGDSIAVNAPRWMFSRIRSPRTCPAKLSTDPRWGACNPARG
jgi:hypothetical protein